MKSYNIDNYVRWKKDIEQKIHKLPEIVDNDFTVWNREQMIIGFTPLVENLARKFSTSQQASGVMTILDIMQDGSLSLIKAIRRIDWVKLEDSDDKEKTLKSFLSKRIKGGIRRAIDMNRGDMRIPEHKLNEIRRNAKDEKMVAMFFNSMFLSIDDKPKNTDDEENLIHQIADKSEPYNIGLLNIYLTGLLRKHLNDREYEVLRLSYGLDCDKHSANKIAEILNIEGSSAYVRVSELKKQAVEKLINHVDHSQVLDYL